MFVDVHCHLEMNDNPEKVIKESYEYSVGKIVSSSVDLDSMKKNLLLSKKFLEIECCFGLHPSNILSMDSREIKASFKFIEQNLFFCKAVGEIGLDFKHAETRKQKNKQIELYKEQLFIAEKNLLPVVVHSRFAEKKSLEILSGFKGKVLLHWFDGNKQALKNAVERNYFFSVGPAILFNQDYLKKVLLIPLNLLMLETDSPVEFKGKPARPFWVKKVAEKLAEEKQIRLHKLEKQTTKNARQFFSF